MRIKLTTPGSGFTKRARLIAVASGLLAATAVTLPSATAAPAKVTADSVAAVAESLGADATAGTYYDAKAKAFVVNVTDAKAAQTVRNAGAVAKVVEYSDAELQEADADIKALDIAGTSWSVDPVSNKLVVSADSRVTKAQLAKIKATAAAHGSAVKVERVEGEFTKLIQGGNAIYAQAGWRCSLGFNVRSGSGVDYFITAGHCTNGAGSWYANSAKTTLIGPTAGSSFPNNDYGLVRYSSSIARPGTAGGVDITGAASAYVGMGVTRHGSTTGTHSGSVTGLNATVNYGGGDIVYGMIKTNVCAEPGDSGGSLRSGSKAVGLTSGGSGNCTVGGTTYFQPVPEVLSAYGVSLT